MDGYYDWVKEHIMEVGYLFLYCYGYHIYRYIIICVQGAPLNEADHCGDPPLLLAAGNGALLYVFVIFVATRHI